jgi:hypothetical protein
MLSSRRYPVLSVPFGSGVAPMWPQRPHPYHSCCRPPLLEGAEVKRSGLSVADRGEPEASCPAWHGDGTAGEDEHASRLAAVAPARAMGEARPGRPEPRWQASSGGAADSSSSSTGTKLMSWPRATHLSSIDPSWLRVDSRCVSPLEVQRSGQGLARRFCGFLVLGDPPAGCPPAMPPNRWPDRGHQEAGRHADRPCRPGREHRHPG